MNGILRFSCIVVLMHSTDLQGFSVNASVSLVGLVRKYMVRWSFCLIHANSLLNRIEPKDLVVDCDFRSTIE